MFARRWSPPRTTAEAGTTLCAPGRPGGTPRMRGLRHRLTGFSGGGCAEAAPQKKSNCVTDTHPRPHPRRLSASGDADQRQQQVRDLPGAAGAHSRPESRPPVPASPRRGLRSRPRPSPPGRGPRLLPGHPAEPTATLTVSQGGLRTAPEERARFAAGAVRRRETQRRRLSARRPQHTRRPFSTIFQN